MIAATVILIVGIFVLVGLGFVGLAGFVALVRLFMRWGDKMGPQGKVTAKTKQ